MKKTLALCFIALLSLGISPSGNAEPAKAKEFEFICKLIPNGLKTNALQPRVAIATAKDVATGEELSGVQYYYTLSTVSFEDAGTPNSDDPQVPEDGIKILPESLRPDEYLTIPPFGTWYINIMAEADGYRDCYARVKVRNWQFGKNYDTIDGTAFINEKSTRDFPKSYKGIQFSHFAYTRLALLNRISVTPGNLVSVKLSTDGHAMLYLKGDSPKGSVITFHHNGEDIETVSIMGPASAAAAAFTPVCTVTPGDKLSFRAAEFSVQVYDIAVLEQQKSNP